MSSSIRINGIISSADFVKTIDDFAREKNIEYIDAVVEYCRQHNIEIETAAAIIKSSPLIKSKIQAEAEELNILPRTPKLQFEE